MPTHHNKPALPKPHVMKQPFLMLLATLCLHLHTQAQAPMTPTGAMAPQQPLPALPAAYGTGMLVNYVRTWEARQATTDTSSAGLNNNALYKTATAYVDGLGRPLQTIIKGNNYDGTKDIVSMNLYDEFGREVKQYLPYATAGAGNGKFRVNAFAEQQTYYHVNYQDQTPFSQTAYEASPLNRPLQTNAPGNNWAGAGRGVAVEYAVNAVTDDVKIATIVYVASGTPVFGNAYSAGQLLKTTTTDEHGKKVVEYKDKSGQVLLKKVQLANNPGAAYSGWLCTYYIYDDFNRLRFVVQPKGVDWLIAHGWNFSQPGGATVKSELCFQYEYDPEGRMVMKKVPGAGEVYMCYDNRDRLVYMQDANMRNTGGSQPKWMVTFYDDLNRPVSTALYNTSQTRSQLQAGLEGLVAPNPVPAIAENLLTRLSHTYYDEYTMPGGTAYDAAVMSELQNIAAPGDELADAMARTECTRGMVTGTQTRVLGTANFIKTTTHYDAKGRPVQTQGLNHKGGADVVTMLYSFTGKVLAQQLTHGNPAATLPGTQTTTVRTTHTYNNNYLLKTERQVNSQPWVQLVQMEYDDMGKPLNKQMGEAASNFNVRMSYNIRGWLTGINKQAQQDLESGNAAPGDFYSAIFSQVLYYDYGFTQQNYNGNISGQKWVNAADKQTRSYGYDYDNANRLLQADFTELKEPGGTTWNTANNIDYSLTAMGYDANGNITQLAQKALLLNSSPLIDQLSYTYLPHSNRLAKVTDAAAAGGTLGDFKDGNNTTDDYDYDANGNMIVDANKNISPISYNHLNLPQTISVTGKGTIEYTYDAAGAKLQKKVTEGNKVTVTDYIGGFVYTNDTLQYAGHEEGRMRYAQQRFLNGETAYSWQMDYFYKDHLGNTRAVVTEQRDTAHYMATFETHGEIRQTEKKLFHNIEETAMTVADAGAPADNTTTPNDYLSRLNGDLKKTGAALTLKVMAGDKIDLAVKYWYPQYNTIKNNDPVTPDDLLGVLTAALSGDASALSGGKATVSQLNQPGVVPAVLADFLATQSGEPNTAGQLKAFINWILLDSLPRSIAGNSLNLCRAAAALCG
jgi:hypothetical protein